MRRRILFLTPQLPYPPEQGTAIRNYNLLAEVARRHDVALLSFVRDPQAPAGPLAEFCRPLRTVPVPSRTPADRLRTLALSATPDMARRLDSPAFARALHELVTAEAFDLIQIEGIELAHYGLLVQEWLGPRAPALIFDDHNAEYVLQRRAFETDIRRPRRWPWGVYSLIQWRRLAHFERTICCRAAGVVAVSEADAAALRQLDPALAPLVVPNGVDLARYHPGLGDTLPLEHPAIVFTGKMDFRPNIDAVLWFAAEVWPLVRNRLPTARLYIVGQAPHPRIAALGADPRLVVTGYVPDIIPYFGGADVYIAPLRIGGGTRLKILEALAAGLPLVATTVGAEGINVRSGEHALLADSPAAFAEAIIHLTGDPAAAQLMGERGRALVAAQYDWRALAPRLDALYDRAMGGSGNPQE